MLIYRHTNSVNFWQFQILTYENNQETELYKMNTINQRSDYILKGSNFGGQIAPFRCLLLWHICSWAAKAQLKCWSTAWAFQIHQYLKYRSRKISLDPPWIIHQPCVSTLQGRQGYRQGRFRLPWTTPGYVHGHMYNKRGVIKGGGVENWMLKFFGEGYDDIIRERLKNNFKAPDPNIFICYSWFTTENWADCQTISGKTEKGVYYHTCESTHFRLIPLVSRLMEMIASNPADRELNNSTPRLWYKVMIMV